MTKIIFTDLLKLTSSKKINSFIIFTKIKACEDHFTNVTELHVDW